MRVNLKKLSIGIAIALAIGLAAIVVVSQGGRGPHGRGFGPGGPGGFRDGLGPMARDLNLTDDQKAQIQKITDSFEESNKALHEQMRALRDKEPNPVTTAFDESAVRAAAQARAGVQVELEVNHAKMMSQIFALLTPEQKTQLEAKHKEFEQKRGSWGPMGPEKDGR
jgi:Spy/CpxP family protein refolding chaperone